MHRLLARVLRERDQARGQWVRTVTAALNLLEPLLFPEVHAWSRREEGARLAAQVEALWDADAGTATGDRDLALRQLQARSCVVRQLNASADVSRAIAAGIRTLADAERTLGADHPDTLTSRNNLAGAYEETGRLEEAIPLYERTLADAERSRAPTTRRRSPRGTTSLPPTSRRAGWRRRSRCTSGPWPTASGSWAPTTRRRSARGTISKEPESRAIPTDLGPRSICQSASSHCQAFG
jgi:tetratricopeptide (TPR) repeat protein